jgi:hypothetical protein
VLEVEYPDEYPSVVPVLNVDIDDMPFIQDEEAEEDEESDGPPKDEFPFTKEDLNRLKTIVDESAEENVGMASIFTLVSLLKDSAEELHVDKIKAKEAQRERILREQEEKEQSKFRGTPVTPESFAAWRVKFRKEFNLDDKNETVSSTKLTGKQIFEQGLNKEDDELVDDDEVVQGVEDMSISPP